MQRRRVSPLPPLAPAPVHPPCRWRRQNQVLLEGHAAALAAQAEEQEARLAEAELRCAELQGALAEGGREAEELRRQLEEDADREVEELRAQYEAKLQVSQGEGLDLGRRNQ